MLANAVAFGSAYVAGAWSAGFILVLVLHHEVQYLYFTYAMARRARPDRRPGLGGELRLLGSFAVWPTVGLAIWAACTLSGLAWLSPFLAAGLLSHYWLDGRIWTAGWRSGDGWRRYSPDTSGASAERAAVLEHRDHVHVDVYE